jgi:hypothetical protein
MTDLVKMGEAMRTVSNSDEHRLIEFHVEFLGALCLLVS